MRNHQWRQKKIPNTIQIKVVQVDKKLKEGARKKIYNASELLIVLRHQNIVALFWSVLFY